MCTTVLENKSDADVTDWCFHKFFFFFSNKAHGDITLLYNIIMLSRGQNMKGERGKRETAPLVSLLRYPHPSQEQLIERSHILLYFVYFFFWSPVPLQFLRMSA